MTNALDSGFPKENRGGSIIDSDFMLYKTYYP